MADHLQSVTAATAMKERLTAIHLDLDLDRLEGRRLSIGSQERFEAAIAAVSILIDVIDMQIDPCQAVRCGECQRVVKARLVGDSIFPRWHKSVGKPCPGRLQTAELAA